ncbi:DUF6101 family protein [Methylobrevis pamukkalensis]|uniref:Uncharacterized protein n=1 Tax=Methylobrevis pamukkalensis TaxID=1439726 RepID=A0A1E3H767_9HYPH|nr:DUF6101 family protein [Methylobrevis pamukkalensis]ODN71616.1 hypothetical protein A6302_01037 [Methylobrevis pamukkalensis]
MTGAHSQVAGETSPDRRALPARFHLDAGAAAVYLDARRVVMRRSLSGLPLTLTLPVTAYRGVAVRIEARDDTRLGAVIELAHADPALTIPLLATDDLDEATLAWEGWSETFGLPMLLRETDGSLREMEARPSIETAEPLPRRRRPVAGRRRPRFLMRRKCGHSRPMPVIEGTEIIART